MKISETIKKIREQANLNQEEFANILKCRQSTVSRYEESLRTPSLKMAMKIYEFAKSKKIKVKLEDFLNGEE